MSKSLCYQSPNIRYVLDTLDKVVYKATSGVLCETEMLRRLPDTKIHDDDRSIKWKQVKGIMSPVQKPSL